MCNCKKRVVERPRKFKPAPKQEEPVKEDKKNDEA